MSRDECGAPGPGKYLSPRVIVVSARPGRVHAEVAIDAPVLRDHAFRRSHTYLEQCVAVSGTLEAAMSGPAAVTT